MASKVIAPVLDRIIELSPKRDLKEFLRTFDGKVFWQADYDNVAMEGFSYVRKTGQPCVVIFNTWWTVLENGVDCMQLARLMATIRQDEWIKTQEAENGK